ncbi:sensor histidine kinase [Treponema ruminis]|uniref:Two-component system sensor histidine kinase YesM n=1 Tax=Treponema ruminis TaxID=744515 RepID=A0A7W8GAY8_9SPIR|nr:sensor histidine kinase [Treponema ruminis]MBB5227093.1 two-component system sensor histidine kinase YesM [Treponema ruminis]
MKNQSLRKTVKFTYIILLSITLIPSIFSIVVSQIHTQRYNKIISNVSKANKINSIAKNDIPEELWNIICGKKEIKEGRQYEMMNEITFGLEEMLRSTKSNESRDKLEVATRASATLLRNIHILIEQMGFGSTVRQNEESLDEIRTIAVLFSDIMQDFIVAESESASETNLSIKNASIILTVIQFFITVVALFVSANSFLTVSGVILEEQKNFQKAEMKALQAQITPHFLYNTFDTIVWLAEEEKTDEVVRITKAFSDFLRISLSRGHEWITIGQELDHIKNYLTIQKIRYADILNYKIEADESLLGLKMIKLVLQPLVENAIYHGIKNKRGRGELSVSVKYAGEDKKKIRFEVKDNGAGFTEARLAEVRLELSLMVSEKLNSVYGLYNVNKKLKLYYGEQTEGLVIESEPGKGSSISFEIPCENGEAAGVENV